MRFELVEAQEHPELVRYRYWYAHRDASQEAVTKAKAWAGRYGKTYRTFAWSEDSQDMFPRPAAYKRKKF
ncbi:hypothetical protein J005_02750 [Cryptococcus neoformans]|nr:hypothetical protein J005_02750 [Cryptococcus neoformans var. grubii]